MLLSDLYPPQQVVQAFDMDKGIFACRFWHLGPLTLTLTISSLTLIVRSLTLTLSPNPNPRSLADRRGRRLGPLQKLNEAARDDIRNR